MIIGSSSVGVDPPNQYFQLGLEKNIPLELNNKHLYHLRQLVCPDGIVNIIEDDGEDVIMTG